MTETAKHTEPPTARGRRSRQALLDAARHVFARDGFADARITDIADEANSAHGSFYTYFDSKEAIFIALLRELEEELWSPGRRTDKAATPYEQILRANRVYLDAYVQNREMMIVWEQVATLNAEVEALRREAADRFERRIEIAIAKWQDEDLIAPGLDSQYAAAALTGMVSNFVYRWCARGSPYDLDTAAEQLSILWANALGIARQNNPESDG